MRIKATVTNGALSHVASVLVLVLGLAYAAVLHYKLGMDGSWDAANYHWFIGWAALNMSPYDYGAVAQYHTYLNPIIDVINYLAFSVHPFVGATIHAIALALAILVVYLIGVNVLDVKGGRKLTAFAAAAIGATGAMTVSLFGSLTNEHITSLLILLALYLVIMGVREGRIGKIITAGLLLGFSVGLKLTATPYVIGLLVTIAICARLGLRGFFFVCAAVGVGLFIADGAFMILRWEVVDSPFFPFANNIFQSPYFPPEWKTFNVFAVNKVPYYLSLPAVWLGAGDFSEANQVRDGRILLAYMGLVFIAISIIQKRNISRPQLIVALFFVVSWLAWILIFRIYRYLVVLEMLSGVVFLVGVVNFFGTKSNLIRVAVVLLASLFLYHVTVYPNWGRRAWQDNFTESNLIDVIGARHVDVIFYADQRLSYLSPQLASSNIAFRNLYSQPWFDGDRIGNPIDPNDFQISDQSNVYLLQYSRSDPRLQSRYLKELFDGDIYSCEEVQTNMLLNPHLCSFKNVPSIPTASVGGV